MKPGQCKFRNLEYDTVLTHDNEGFRNRRRTPQYDVAALGDSHAQGWGVGDDQTFSSLLESQFGYSTKNLAVASYATMRELEVLDKYGKDAKYVIVQYCNNDFAENDAAIKLTKEEFRSQVEAGWKNFIATYHQGKAMGYRKPLNDLGVMIRDHGYTSKSNWRKGIERRSMEQEASAFAQVIARFRPLLEGKRVLVFESADSGMNSPRFVETFATELSKVSWLHFRIMDVTKVLGFGDYYFLDGHPKPTGHRKLAAALAGEINQWESTDPLLNNR
ncbi:MAG: SGNH/GDSL hydrolase family protein [Acidobacteriota bacterium]